MKTVFIKKTTLKPVSVPEGVYVPRITYLPAILFPLTLRIKSVFDSLGPGTLATTCFHYHLGDWDSLEGQNLGEYEVVLI